MLPPPGIPPDLPTRIDRWRQHIVESALKSAHESAQEAVKNESNGHKRRLDLSTSLPRYQTRLQTRVSNQRAALAETTSNPRLCKQKASQDHTTAVSYVKIKRGQSMQDESEGIRGGKRPRGRPRKDLTSEGSQQAVVTPLPDKLMFLPDLSIRPSEASPQRRKSQSPRKKTSNNLGQTRTNANVTMAFLKTCQPSVQLLSYERIRSLATVRPRMPAAVEELHNRLQKIPNGLIPSELKNAFEADASTPRKTKDAPEADVYLHADTTPYPQESLSRLKTIVSTVVKDAMWDHEFDAHEGQWGMSVVQIIGEFRLWPCGENLKLLNVETCTINPVEFRPTMPNGAPLALEGDLETASGTSEVQEPRSMARMVDWCLGLELGYDVSKLVTTAFGMVRMNETSLNQTVSFIRQCPLFLDIEIKKAQTNRNPEVQLAIWAAGALRKKQHHGWDTNLPMPAIAVNGNNWDYYLFFGWDDELIMMGPSRFGTTADAKGVWEIFYRLDLLIKWGLTEYKSWVDNNILAWCRRLVEQQHS